MAYEGYRIKINNASISDNMIVKGSYSFQRGCRVIDSYYDATGVLVEEKSSHKTVVIQFTVRERSISEHANVMSILAIRDNVSVEYWDDETATYQTAICKIHDVTIAHANTHGKTIRYADMPIMIEEY